MSRKMLLRRAASWLLAGATLLLAALCVWHVIDLCQAGLSPENQPSPGVFVQPVFAPEAVSAHLAQMAWAFRLWLAALVLSCAAQWLVPDKEKTITRKRAMALYRPKHGESSRVGLVRTVLLIAACAMVIAGVMNGGMWDVLVKAINICTECIGLG